MTRLKTGTAFFLRRALGALTLCAVTAVPALGCERDHGNWRASCEDTCWIGHPIDGGRATLVMTEVPGHPMNLSDRAGIGDVLVIKGPGARFRIGDEMMLAFGEEPEALTEVPVFVDEGAGFMDLGARRTEEICLDGGACEAVEVDNWTALALRVDAFGEGLIGAVVINGTEHEIAFEGAKAAVAAFACLR